MAWGWMEAAGKCRPDEQGGSGNNLSDVCCVEVRVLFLSSPPLSLPPPETSILTLLHAQARPGF